MTTTLNDILPDIVQKHILPHLDGPSLSATATTSSHLKTLCSNDTLWSQISKTTWPSITHPYVDHLISNFPAGYRSFFNDSFPTLTTDVNNRNPRPSWSTPKQPHYSSSSCDHLSNSMHPCPSQLISAVDIRYQNEVIYSAVEFTRTTNFDFHSSPLQIEFNQSPISKLIDLEVDEIAGADKATLSHVKESLTLSWIIIDPTRKRAGNVSSIKPVSARQDWTGNETIVRFVTVLAGSEPGELVQCKIKLVLGVCKGGLGLHVKDVSMKLMDLNRRCLDGREFLVIMGRAILEEKNVRRKVMDDGERWREFKEMKREKKEWERVEEEKREFGVMMNYVLIWVSFSFSFYFLFRFLH